MTTLDVTFVRLSECALAAAAHLAVARTNASTIHVFAAPEPSSWTTKPPYA
jgi:hypothetical protein